MRKTGTLSIMLFIFMGVSISQSLPTIIKKMYVAPDGNIYIQKSLPVYFRIATSPDDNAPSYLLKSSTTPKYANPMYLDTEGYNSLHSPSAVDTVTKRTVIPLKDVIFEVFSDSNSPKTSVKIENSYQKPYKGKTYVKEGAHLVLNATDELSGVDKIYYSIDSAEYKIYESPLTFEKEKEYLIKYFSSDNVGNVEKIRTIIIVSDFSKPKTTKTIVGDSYENIISGRAVIKLASEDKGIGVNKIYYSIDEGKQKTYSSPINMAQLEQGDHKLVYFSDDMVENTEVEDSFNFYVDKTPPAIVQDIVGKSFVANGREFSSGRSQLKITTFDNKAGIQDVFYSINDGEYVKYDKPLYLANSSGNLSIKSYAVDKVNNKSFYDESKNEKTALSYVDLTGPILNSSFNGPIFLYGDTIFINHKTNIILKATDPEAGMNRIEYSVNQGEMKVYENPIKIAQEGFTTINYIGYDNVDNTNNSSISFMVDTTGPSISLSYSAPIRQMSDSSKNKIYVYPSHLVIFISSFDIEAGYDKMMYTLNGSAKKEFSGSISGFPKGNNQLQIIVSDKLENITTKEITFFIDDESRKASPHMNSPFK